MADVWLIAITIWYLTGLLAALGFSLGFYLLRPAAPGLAENRDPLDAFTWMDGKWYKQIAVEGYHYDPDARSNVAFFPVYPLLARALMAITGLRAEAALLIVSNFSLLAALAALCFYVRARYRDGPAELADWVVLAAALFPTGCFFRFAYSESTFLLLAVTSMYGMLRRWPLAAIALLVGLTTATRPVGVALLAPLAIHVVREMESDSPGRSEWRAITARSLAKLLFYSALACWGLFAFLGYQLYAFGDALATVRTQEYWGKPAPWNEKLAALVTLAPFRTVYDPYSEMFWASRDRHGLPWFSLQFANPLWFGAALFLIAFGSWRRWLSPSETTLSTLLLAIPYVTRAREMGMGSMGRFAAVVFPIYLTLGHILARLPTMTRAVAISFFGFLLAVYTALYAARYLIF